MNNYTIACAFEADSPITHMSGTVGNEGIVAREPVITDKGPRWVPHLSGNALRHRCIREPGVLWLIEQYELTGKLSLPQLNFLLHGGNLSESTAHENTARIAEMKRTWPLLRLCGGCLPNQVLSGSLDVWRGTLVCEENRRSLASTIGGSLPAERLLAAEHFVSDYQYTRGDGAKTGLAVVAGGDENRETNLMIYAGQAVARGSVFIGGFVLKHVSAVELGAMLWSLRLWQANGGTIGGQAARGHGRLNLTLLGIDSAVEESAVAEYCEYALSVRDDAVAWLHSCFAKGKACNSK